MSFETPERQTPVLVRAGKYNLQHILGRGAASVVYRAQRNDHKHGDAAVKVFLPDWLEHGEGDETFAAEVSLLCSLDHPAIVKAYEAGETDEGFPFIAYELVNGQPLSKLLVGTSFTYQRTCELVLTLADALDHAHKQMITHRDIKPGNIMVRDGQPVLIDFGLALTDESFGDERTAGAGTPCYTSPEQAAGMGHLADGRSDLFSLGAVFYEMLTGTRPFQGENQEESLHRVLNFEPRPVRCFDERLPAEVERICHKCLSKRQDARYSVAGDLAADLRTLLDKLKSPRSDTSAPTAVPCGLRAFTHRDADFFAQLLPGPIVAGIPEVVHFWKEWIEDPIHESGIGVIYGCSGAGKTSLVRAGILPALSEATTVLYLPLSEKGSEKRLRKELYQRCPYLPHGLSLEECITEVNTGRVLAGGKKLLVVLDQFEHWLQRQGEDIADNPVAQMLRQFDGQHARCLIVVRHDFWLELSRLFLAIDEPLSTGENARLVDTFDQSHARTVLEAFGRAIGKFPQSGKLAGPERKFLKQAISEIADSDERVRPATLSLLTHVLRAVTWDSKALKGIGGIDGIGEKFLDQVEQELAGRAHFYDCGDALRILLDQLVPSPGNSLKRSAQPIDRLANACRLAVPKLTELLHFLDREERLVAPADGKADRWQLCHDVLVSPIRHWLRRDREKTWRGRVALRKESHAASWQSSDRRPDLVPPLSSWLQYLCVKNRTPVEKSMMRAAHRRQLPVIIAAVLLTGFLLSFGWQWKQRNDATLTAHMLTTATTADRLEAALERVPSPPSKEINDLLAAQGDSLGKLLVTACQGQKPYDLERILAFTDPDLLPVVAKFLDPDVVSAKSIADNSEIDRSLRLRACALLARLDWLPDDLWWETRGAGVASRLLIRGNPKEAGEFAPLFTSRCSWLIPEIEPIYRDPADANVGLTAAFLLLEWKKEFGVSKLVNYGAKPYQFRFLSSALPTDALGQLGGIEEVEALRVDDGPAAAARLVLMRAALGDYQQAWHVLAYGAPDVRTSVIFGWQANDLPSAPLVDKLKQKDVAPLVRHGCLLALGEFAEIPPGSLDIIEQLASTAKDAATLNAARWLLDHWQQPLPAPIAATAATHDNNWFLTDHQQIMVKAQDSAGKGFAISAGEVTESEFARFGPKAETLVTSKLPVTDITRDQAKLYCNQLSLLEQLQPCYVKVKGKWELAKDWAQRSGYRLPMDSEWELACRAGTGTRHAFGDRKDWAIKFVWFAENSKSDAGTPERQPTAKLRPNPWGIFDMLGNAREMCENPRIPNTIRGGTYIHPSVVANSQRFPSFRLSTSPSLGFRLARSLAVH